MIRYYLIFIFILVHVALLGQKFPHEEWHNGRVVLSSYDTIPGKIKYDLTNNVVQINPANTKELYAFSAHKLIYFDFTDALSDAFRQFVILPYDLKNNNYEIPVLLEIIREGPLSLFTRERIETEVDRFSSYRSFSRDRLVYDYYFLKENGDIISFDGKKRSLDTIFGSYTDEVKKFIKEEKLKLDRMTDLARIVAFYNQLKK